MTGFVASSQTRMTSHMNAKAKGTRNEHRSMALYETLGYSTIRSAASLGPWDWIAWNKHEIVFGQTKTGRWPGIPEMEIIQEAMVPPHARKVVHRWMPGKHKPDVREV